MNGNQYQNMALRTANIDLEEHEQLINGALGLCGESGEVADMVKKCFMQGHELDVEHLAKELGDCMWYIALIADCIGYGLSGIMQMNVDKLKARYPEGFAVENSVNRKQGDV
ncbi:MAG: nucleoside triphosphate pyrophosphohydrolase family protein [Alphaproteobacteria bacterium]|nr:nucleoside triphosphate pyrophosphohydrolase family protein [Alphaproteobacteria bacterium]